MEEPEDITPELEEAEAEYARVQNSNRKRIRSQNIKTMRREVKDWIGEIIGERIPLQKQLLDELKSGEKLLRFANVLNRYKHRYDRQTTERYEEEQPLVADAVDDTHGETITEAQAASRSRSNVAKFLQWCGDFGVPQIIFFESEDLVSKKNEMQVLNCILYISRIVARYGIEPPESVKVELEQEKNRHEKTEKMEPINEEQAIEAETKNKVTVQASVDSAVERNGVSPSYIELNDGDASLPDAPKLGLTSESLNDLDKEKATVEISVQQNSEKAQIFDNPFQKTSYTQQNLTASGIKSISEQQPLSKEGFVQNEFAADANETPSHNWLSQPSAAANDRTRNENNELSPATYETINGTTTNIERYANNLLADIQLTQSDLSTNDFGHSNPEITFIHADTSSLVSSFLREKTLGTSSEATMRPLTEETFQESNPEDDSFNSHFLSATEMQYQRKRSTLNESQDPQSPFFTQTVRLSDDYHVTASINDDSKNLPPINQNTEAQLQASVAATEELPPIRDVNDFKSYNETFDSTVDEEFPPIKNGGSFKPVKEVTRFTTDDGDVYTLPSHRFRKEIPVKAASYNHEKEDADEIAIETPKSGDKKPTDKERASEKLDLKDTFAIFDEFQTRAASSTTTSQQNSVSNTLQKARKTANRYTIVIIIASVLLVLVIGALIAMSIVFTQN